MAALGNGQGFKNLAQAQATAALATLYTVPAGTGTVIAQLTVTNLDTVARTFAVQHAIAAAAAANAQYVYFNLTIGPNETLEILHGMTLAATDLIRIIADVTLKVSFNLYGQEFV